MRKPRRAHDDDVRVAAGGLLDDREPGASLTHEPLDHAHAVQVSDVVRLVEERVGERLLLGNFGVQRQVEWDDDHAHRDDRRAPLGREP